MSSTSQIFIIKTSCPNEINFDCFPVNKTSYIGPLPWRETIQYLAFPSDVRGPPDDLCQALYCSLPERETIQCLALPSDGRGPSEDLWQALIDLYQSMRWPSCEHQVLLTFVFTLISFQMFSKDHAEQITPLSGPKFTACTVSLGIDHFSKWRKLL